MRPLIIYGAGGLGREVALTVRAVNGIEPTWELLGFADDGAAPDAVGGLANLGGFAAVEAEARAATGAALSVVVAIGSAAVVADLTARLRALEVIEFPNLIHPDATVDLERVSLGEGNLICCGARLTADLRIGSFSVINMNAVLAHDVVVGDRCQINPGALINGQVVIGDDVVVGAGAVLMPRISIGSGATVALGAVVGASVEPDDVVAGNPARVVKRGTR